MPVLVVFLLVATAATADRTPEQKYLGGEAEYRQACTLQGFTRGTPPYEDCIIRMVNQWEQTAHFPQTTRPQIPDAIAPAMPQPETARTVDPNSLEGRLTRAYGERCELAGYQAGTGAFGQCLLAYSDRDEQTRRAITTQLLLNQMNRPQAPSPLATMPTYGQHSCTSILGNTVVTTTCR